MQRSVGSGVAIVRCGGRCPIRTCRCNSQWGQKARWAAAGRERGRPPGPPASLRSPAPLRSHVLIEQDRIAVRVDDDEMGGAGGLLVGLLHELDALLLQTPLDLPDVREGWEPSGVGVPT